ncbi:MAG: hypothetical protein M3247_07145 [Thermoproteota archaeon]|nr:hypothetical protein [Thermoproteota archaeon]
MIQKVKQTYKKGNSPYRNFGTYFPKSLVETVDQVRGDIPRSRWLRHAVTEKLQRDSNSSKKENAAGLSDLQTQATNQEASQTVVAVGSNLTTTYDAIIGVDRTNEP